MLQTILKIYLVMSNCLIIAVLLFVVPVYIARHFDKEIPCNHCKYLVQKGGNWKYTCCRPDMYIHHSFDKAPTYCQYFKEKESN